MKCWDKGFYVRYGGDTIQLGLPFIVSEKQIKDETRATIRCIPFDKKNPGKCIVTGKSSECQVFFAKSY